MGLLHKLAEQHRQPEGLLGRLIGLQMAQASRQANYWAISLLDLQATDQVLEVGFGPGQAIQEASRIVSQGRVAGVDFSETMLEQARRRNARGIAAGRVDLRLGDIACLHYGDDTFDKAFAVNLLYFLPEPLSDLRELWRVMKPGGRVVLFLVAKEAMEKLPFVRGEVFRLYSGPQVVEWMQQAGFRQAWLEARDTNLGSAFCVIAEK